MDFSKVIELIAESKKANLAIKNQKVFFLLGSTGAGKTTTIQFLSGNDLIEDEDGKIVLKDPSCSKLKIGTQQKSETRFIAAQEIKYKDSSLIFVDGPGFNDTEGPEMDLANAVSIAEVFQQCSEVVPILLVSHATLIADRGRLFRDLINFMCSMFPARELKKSIVLWISQTPDKFKLPQLIKVLQGVIDADSKANTEDLITIIEHFIEEIENEEKTVGIIKPLSDTVTKYHTFLHRRKGIKDPSKTFKFSLNEEVQSKLSNTLKTVEMNIETWLKEGNSQKLNDFLKSFQIVGEFVGTVKISFNVCQQKLNSWILHNQSETIQRFENILKNKIFIEKDCKRLNELSIILKDVQVLKEYFTGDILTVQNLHNLEISQLSSFEKQIEQFSFDFEKIKTVADIILQFSRILELKEEEIEEIYRTAQKDIKETINKLKDTLTEIQVEESSLDALVEVIENLTVASDLMKSHVELDIKSIIDGAIVLIKQGFNDAEEEFNSVFTRFTERVSSGSEELEAELKLPAEAYEQSETKKQIDILAQHFSLIKQAASHKKLTKYLAVSDLQERFKRMVGTVVSYCNKTLDSMQEKLSAVDVNAFSQFQLEIDIISKFQEINEDIKQATSSKNQKFLKSLGTTITSALDEVQKESEKEEPDSHLMNLRLKQVKNCLWLDSYTFGVTLKYKSFMLTFESSISFISRKALAAWDRQRYDEVLIQINKLEHMAEVLEDTEVNPVEQVKDALSKKKEKFYNELIAAINKEDEIGIEEAEYYFKWIKSTKKIFESLLVDEKDKMNRKKLRSKMVAETNKKLEQIPTRPKGDEFASLDFPQYKKILDYFLQLDSIEILKNKNEFKNKYKEAKERLEELIEFLIKLFNRFMSTGESYNSAKTILEQLEIIPLTSHFKDHRDRVDKLWGIFYEKMGGGQANIAQKFNEGNYVNLEYMLSELTSDARANALRELRGLIQRKQTELKGMVQNIRYPIDNAAEIVKCFQTLIDIGKNLGKVDTKPTPQETVVECYKFMDATLIRIIESNEKLRRAQLFAEWDDVIDHLKQFLYMDITFEANCPRTTEFLKNQNESPLKADVDKTPELLAIGDILAVNTLYRSAQKLAETKALYKNIPTDLVRHVASYIDNNKPTPSDSISEQIAKLEKLERNLNNLEPELKRSVSFNSIVETIKSLQEAKSNSIQEIRDALKHYDFSIVKKNLESVKDPHLLSDFKKAIQEQFDFLYRKIAATSQSNENPTPNPNKRNHSRGRSGDRSVAKTKDKPKNKPFYPSNAKPSNAGPLFYVIKADEAEHIFTKGERPAEVAKALNSYIETLSVFTRKSASSPNVVVSSTKEILSLISLDLIKDVLNDDANTSIQQTFQTLSETVMDHNQHIKKGALQGNFQIIKIGLDNVEKMDEFIVEIKKAVESSKNNQFPQLVVTLQNCQNYEESVKYVQDWIKSLPQIIDKEIQKKNFFFLETLLQSALTNSNQLESKIPGISAKAEGISTNIKNKYDTVCTQVLENKRTGRWDEFNKGFSLLTNWRKIGDKLNDDTCSKIEKEIVDDIDSIEEKGVASKTTEEVADSLVDLYEIAERFPHVRPKVEISCKGVIKKQSIAAGATKDQFVQKLSMKLKEHGRHGNEIIMEYPEFAEIQRKLWVQKTSQQNIDFGIEHFITTGGKQTMWSKITNLLSKDVKTKWKEDYNAFDACFKDLVQSGLGKPSAIPEIVQNTEKIFSKTVIDLPIALAHIFAVWSLEKSSFDADNISAAREYILQPHAIQVLCLFILLTAENRTQYASQFIEILTGEGKSVILGVSSTFFALRGYDVSCTSYSQYLSARDYHDFEKIFQDFKVESYISYMPITELSEQMINSRGNIRELARNVLQNQSSSAFAGAISSRKRVLLIDEVDVFFGTDFYGETYNPATIYSDDNTFSLLQYIYNNRSSNLTFQSISGIAAYTNLLSLFPGWEGLIRNEVLKMLVDVKDFANPIYKVINDKICYLNQDTYSSNIVHRYKTAFVYFFELDKAQISSNTVVKQNTGLLLGCGSFSFAEIPRQFDLIMGVSGTLSDFSDVEKKIIEDYNITKLAFAPSVYGQSRRSFFPDQNVKVYQDKNEWFLYIYQMAENKTRVGRAVLIFFETIELINEFMQSQGNNFAQPPGILHEAEEFKENVVRKSTASGQVTLCTRPFGRGVDFVCRDDVTLEKGGVHVILGFPSYSEAEEIQVRGRTARQGDVGSWEIVLFIDDLQHLSISWEQYQQQGANFYEYLKKERDTKLKENLSKLIEKAQKASVLHNHSSNFHKLLTSGGKREEIVKCIQEINMSGVKVTSDYFHIYFCLDDSGSMGGAPWNELMAAVGGFIKKRMDFFNAQGLPPNDLVTIVNYSSNAEVMCRAQPINSNPQNKTRFRSGGTDFSAGLAAVYNELKSLDATRIPALLFMSDGGSSNGEREMQLISRDFTARNIKVFTIGFSSGCNKKKMESLAVIGGGKFFFGIDGASLKSEFESICSEISSAQFSV